MSRYVYLVIVESDKEPSTTANIIKLHFNSLPWISNIVIKKMKHVDKDKYTEYPGSKRVCEGK